MVPAKIQKATGIRRITAADYLRAGGINLRLARPGGRLHRQELANAVTPDPGSAQLAAEISADPFPRDRPNGVPPTLAQRWRCAVASTLMPQPGRSIGERLRVSLGGHRVVALAGPQGQGDWQDLVDIHGFAGGYQSVKRFVRHLRGIPSPEVCVVIETTLGGESHADYCTGPVVRYSFGGSHGSRTPHCPTLSRATAVKARAIPPRDGKRDCNDLGLRYYITRVRTPQSIQCLRHGHSYAFSASSIS